MEMEIATEKKGDYVWIYTAKSRRDLGREKNGFAALLTKDPYPEEGAGFGGWGIEFIAKNKGGFFASDAIDYDGRWYWYVNDADSYKVKEPRNWNPPEDLEELYS